MSTAPKRLLFDDFELRLDSGELLRAGSPVKLQPQPAKILEILASRCGEMVSREEIRQLVWGDSEVDSDASLNFCIKEIRRVLGDSATSPTFVETVPRRGYRFLKPVTAEPFRPPPPSSTSGRWSRLGTVGVFLALLALLAVLIAGRFRQVPPHPQPAPPKKRPAAGVKASSPADEAYLRGIYLRRHKQYDAAAAALQEATLLYPSFAPAYAELALVRLQTPSMVDTPSGVEVTEAAARHALELEPNLADAHLALGQILLHHSHDWTGAGRELQKALELDPGNAEAHHVRSLYLAALGRHAEALASAERARQLDPASMLVGSGYAWLLYLDHRYEEAIREARKILALFPRGVGDASQEAQKDRSFCESTILYSSWKLGDQQTALGAAKAFLEIEKLPAPGLRDMEDFWRGQERHFEAQLRDHPVDPFELARNALSLGRRDRALDLLTQHCAPQGIGSPFTAVDPIFDELHADPRWGQVLDCMKLPKESPARKVLSR